MDPFEEEDGDVASVEDTSNVPTVSTDVGFNINVIDVLIYSNRAAENFPLTRLTTLFGMVNRNQESYGCGYDSDGNMPYFDKTVDSNESPDDYVEDSITSTSPDAAVEEELVQESNHSVKHD